ncbi:ABC transporter permease [Paraburkholderia bryophila]|uniref:Iron(III) transport system permease protein n=1 Tax=Paraburkholderia bryophila TaxID=420952 RepID=A0A329BT67_9BURK|nr:iron ABC transporter permease [Paraburkholderia bryophila]RAS25773.1 iron(III) transport system permease protein [Paraburkholderia bryophila]
MARVMMRAAPPNGAPRGGSAWLLTPLLAALAVLIALPIGFVVLQAIFPLLTRGSFAHPFSAFGAALVRADTLPLLGNTVRFGVSVALASVALGLPLGVVRGLFRLPGARVWDLLFLAPFLIPPYLAAFGWILLLQPNGYLEQLSGVNLGRFLFSFNGVVAAMTLGVFPVVYFSVSRTLAALGGRLADVARVFGAGPWRSFARITLPLMLPALAASALLTFTMAIEEFGVPSALGSRAGFSLMVTSIEERFSDWPIDLPGASVLALLLALLALAAFVLQRRLLAGRDFETQTGKPTATLRRELGRWRWPVLLMFGFVALCAAIAPLFAIVTTAFSRTLSGGFAIDNLTLAHFKALSAGSDGASALGTSLALAAATAFVTGALGFLSAWVVVKTRLRGRAALDALTLLPHALPGIVVGVGLILAWNLPIWPVTPYNTWGILLLSYSCLLLPYPIRYTSAALRQLGSGLEAAARVHGATSTRVLLRIVLPLVAPALISSVMIVFAVASRELVTSLLLAPSGVQTASIFIWQQFEQGSIGDGMAMGTVTLLISGALLGCGARWAKRFDDAA